MGKHSKPEEEKKKKRKSTSKKTNTNKKNSKNNKEQKPKKHIVRKILLTLLVLLLIAGAVFGVIVYKNGGGIKGVVTTFVGTDVDTIKNLEDIYVLCMGKSQNLTDTIIVAKYSPQTQQATLLSIPRDTFVGSNKNTATSGSKINALYQINPQKTIDAVNNVTGLNIKYYVTVDTKALRELVDAIGGVEFDVPIDMDYDDPTQDLEIHIEQGLQVLDGKNAEGVVRFRHNNDFSSYPSEYGDNDIGRMKTQRAFITTVLKQTLRAENLTKINELINIAKERVETNIPWDIVKNYLVALLDFNTENLKSDSLPGEPQYLNNFSFFIPNSTKAKQKVYELFLAQPEEESEETEEGTSTSKDVSSLKLEVLNGTGSNSKFQTAQEQLKENGYKISKKGTTNVTGKTIIIDRTNNSKKTGNEIKSLLCTGNIISGEDNNDVDYTIILGADY